MFQQIKNKVAACGLIACTVLGAAAQTGSDQKDIPKNSNAVAEVIRRLPADQLAIWKSPFRLKADDTSWVVPGVAATAILFGTDADISRKALRRPEWQSRGDKISNAGIAGMAGVTGGMYLWGLWTKDEHRRETGVLAGEAALNAVFISQMFKVAADRKRPIDGGSGRFYTGGRSFFSEHSATAWSIATVVAHEYSGPLTKVLMYGGAAAISASRVAAGKHFASDAFLGSAVGYAIGRQIYRAHHNPELGGEWGTFERTREVSDAAGRYATYVPIDSWVYEAFGRLAAAGVVRSGLSGLRPWTRRECARLLAEARESDLAAMPAEAELVRALSEEFGDPNSVDPVSVGVAIDNVYLCAMHMSGSPLTDGFYAGRTIVNDFGRPFGRGMNTITGVETRAFFGSLSFYLRGEVQQAGEGQVRPPAFEDEIRRFDGVTYPTPMPASSTTRVRPLEAYIGWTVDRWQVSFGKQALLWGPGQGGPLLLSSNAEPFPMLRITRPEPIRLPWIFSLMGPVRTDFFVGQLSGHVNVWTQPTLKGPDVKPQPYIAGHKLSFKPTPNFEFGIGLTSVFGGPGMPFTTRNFFRALYSNVSTTPGSNIDVGDRRSGIDVSYRVPGLRDWATVYVDAMADDWISPLANPRRSVFRAGLYLPKLPKVHKLNFRFEGGYTDMPDALPRAFAYTNYRFRSGYTYNGQLMGNWMGRDARGLQGWATYAFSPATKVELGYRKGIVDPEFLGGGSYWDYSGKFAVRMGRHVSAEVRGQYERWNLPLLSPGRERNFLTSVQLNYRPNWADEN